MFCPKCGTRSAAQSEKCAACGYDFGLIPEYLRGKERATDVFGAEYSEGGIPVYETETAESTEAFSEQTSDSGAERPQTERSAASEPFNEKSVKKARHNGIYMIPAILLTVFGSMAFGIVAIIFSGMTQTELAAGDKEKAAEYSEKTRMFCLISLFVGIAKYLIIGILFAVTVFGVR